MMPPPRDKAPSPLARAQSLLRTGPRALALRFIDQALRKLTGAPVWRLSELSPALFLGGQHGTRGYAAMQARGISAIVNLREAHHNDVARGIAGARHLHLPTIDNTAPRLADLQRGAAFIAAEIARGGKVYVHCGVGVGRAPTLVAAYLIRSGGESPAQALQRIKHIRPFVHLTPGQRQALEGFAAAGTALEREGSIA